MKDGSTWAALKAWSERFDGGRDTSDEAHRWADEEAGLVAMPENMGEWKASTSTAFDAGRQCERMLQETQRDASVLAERERAARLADAEARRIREAEFIGPREAAESLRGVASAIRARGVR